MRQFQTKPKKKEKNNLWRWPATYGNSLTNKTQETPLISIVSADSVVLWWLDKMEQNQLWSGTWSNMVFTLERSERLLWPTERMDFFVNLEKFCILHVCRFWRKKFLLIIIASNPIVIDSDSEDSSESEEEETQEYEDLDFDFFYNNYMWKIAYIFFFSHFME